MSQDIGYDNNSGITFGGTPLKTLIGSNSLSSPTNGSNMVFAPWRNTEAWNFNLTGIRLNINDYVLHNNFVDGKSGRDLPDFWGIGVSAGVKIPVGLSGFYIVDRYGNSYITPSVSVGLGIPGELAYEEGYIEMINGGPVGESTLKNVLGNFGWCVALQAAGGLGISGGGCLMNLSLISTYSAGFQANIGGSFSPYTFNLPKDESLSWEWSIDAQRTGVKRNDLARIPEIVYDGCNTGRFVVPKP